MSVQIITPETEYPVTLAQIKAELDILHNDDDARLTGLLKQATRRIERFQSRALTSKQYRWKTSSLDEIQRLPVTPVLSVDAIRYYDSEGVQQTIATSPEEYRLVGDCVEPVDVWPSTATRLDAFEIDFTAGYASRDDMPADTVSSVIVAVKFLYDDPTGDLPPAIEWLARGDAIIQV